MSWQWHQRSLAASLMHGDFVSFGQRAACSVRLHASARVFAEASPMSADVPCWESGRFLLVLLTASAMNALIRRGGRDLRSY